MSSNTRQWYSTITTVEIGGKQVSAPADAPPRRRPQVFCEPQQQSPPILRACSACAGDYEDPERTTSDPASEGETWADTELRDADVANQDSPECDEFPAAKE